MAAEVEGPGIDWFAAQPYDGWGKARRSDCPVIASEEIAMGPGTTYQITAWKDADAVLRDDKTFASFINMQHIGEFMGELIVGMDGDEHRTYRNLVAKAFRASQLDKWDETLVRPIINELLDAIAPLGHADLVEAVTSRYPIQVICGIAGVPL